MSMAVVERNGKVMEESLRPCGKLEIGSKEENGGALHSQHLESGRNSGDNMWRQPFLDRDHFSM